MERLGIIGSGIAGMGCAHFLQKRFDITLIEKNDYIGGHTNTVTVDDSGDCIPIDTGFIVFNHATYPNLVRLFRELDVATTPTNMSFSVQHVPSGLEFNGSSLGHLFAQRKNMLRPSFYRMLMQINRFNNEAEEVLQNSGFGTMTMAEYVAVKGYGSDFLHKYLIPMSSAVWSTPPDLMLQFPATSLVRFFKNHGFLGMRTQHQWYTVVNGSRSYRDKLMAPLKQKTITKNPAVKVMRHDEGAEVILADGQRATFDRVILACHADEALGILDRPTNAEASLLKEFPYQHNRATLHTDDRVMPKTRRAWASWNYRIDEGIAGDSTASTIYWMNGLQRVSKKQDYFLSINDPASVRKDRIIREIDYTHPIFTLGSKRAQAELSRLNRDGLLYYAGAYFRYGFHEDGLTSALETSRAITGDAIWEDAPGLADA
jgi:predicted NAD/FAD-binding protein